MKEDYLCNIVNIFSWLIDKYFISLSKIKWIKLLIWNEQFLNDANILGLLNLVSLDQWGINMYKIAASSISKIIS